MLRFKTNIKFDACIEIVTPFLNGSNNVDNWKVDTNHLDKLLSIETGEPLNPKEVIMLLNQIGYHAEKI